MRTAVLVLLVSSTAYAEPPRLAFDFRYSLRTETAQESPWFPGGGDVRIRVASHLSLSFGWDAFKSPVLETRGTFQAPAQARRKFLAFHTGAMAHLGDYAYALAGVGVTGDMIVTRWASVDWLDQGDRWRPHAFVGTGVEYRRGHVGVGFEVRAIAMAGSAPTTDEVMATPELSRYALQGSLQLVLAQ